ncbi:MAG: hypothetical protein AAF676_08550, partial [Pseudomonadota bacterium]
MTLKTPRAALTGLAALAAAATLTPTAAEAVMVTVEVDSGAGFVLLGTVEAFVANAANDPSAATPDLAAATYYGLTDGTAPAAGGPGTLPDGIVSHFVLVNEGLSFVTRLNGPGGEAGQASATLDVTTAPAPSLQVSDEPGEAQEVGPPGLGVFSANWTWVADFSDGLMVGALSPGAVLVMNIQPASGSFGAAGWRVPSSSGPSLIVDAGGFDSLSLRSRVVPLP